MVDVARAGNAGGECSLIPPPPPTVPPNVKPEVVTTPMFTIPSRSGTGTTGTRMSLLANHLNVNVKAPDVVFYIYSVHITSEDQRASEGKKIGTKLVDRLYGTYSSELRRTKFAYDAEKALYTVGLPQNKLKLTVVLEETFGNRDGVSESQFNPLLNIELDQIMKAYQHLGEADLTKFTMIVAKNNLQTKLSQTNSPDQVPTGTVVDTKIALPWNYDFYMCAQESLNGTSMPTYFHVLLDEIGFSPDELQNLIHSLSSMQHRRTTTPITTLTPICNSHLTAPQMEKIMKFEDLAKTLLGRSSIISCSMLEKLTLFCALIASAAGAILNFSGNIYPFPAFPAPAGLMALLLLTPPHHKKMRVFLLMVVASSVGASFGLFFHHFMDKISYGTRTPAFDFNISVAYTAASSSTLCFEAYNMVAKRREDLCCAFGEFYTSLVLQYSIGCLILEGIILPQGPWMHLFLYCAAIVNSLLYKTFSTFEKRNAFNLNSKNKIDGEVAQENASSMV